MKDEKKLNLARLVHNIGIAALTYYVVAAIWDFSVHSHRASSETFLIGGLVLGVLLFLTAMVWMRRGAWARGTGILMLVLAVGQFVLWRVALGSPRAAELHIRSDWLAYLRFGAPLLIGGICLCLVPKPTSKR